MDQKTQQILKATIKATLIEHANSRREQIRLYEERLVSLVEALHAMRATE